MDIIIFIGGCLAVGSIVLVFLLNMTLPERKFVKYLPSTIFIIVGVILVPLSFFSGFWTGVGVGLIGIMSFIIGIVILLVTVIMDTVS